MAVIIFELLDRYEILLPAFVGSAMTVIISSVALFHLLHRRRKQTFMTHSLIARSLLFNVYNNCVLLRLAMNNTVQDLTLLSKFIDVVEYIQESTRMVLYVTHFGLILSFAYVMYKGYRQQTLRGFGMVYAISILATSFSLFVAIYQVSCYDKKLLIRVITQHVAIRNFQLVLLINNVNNYVTGFGFIGTTSIILVLCWYLHRRKLFNATLYLFLIKLSLSYIAFRLPHLVISIFFPFDRDFVLLSFVIEHFHGIVDCIIILGMR
jgi:hypothetical protein